MRATTNGITKKLILQIRDLSLQGQADTVWFEGRSDKNMFDAGEDIYWQTAGKFLLVYIESFGEDSYSYRLYRCSGEAWYDRRIVLNPALENEDCRCLLEYIEHYDRDNLVRFDNDEQWLCEFEKTVAGIASE